VIDSNREQVVGNQILVEKSGKIILSPVWTFSSPGTKILKLVFVQHLHFRSTPTIPSLLQINKPTEEVVHSQGRVMADRSVLFKYINPNLVSLGLSPFGLSSAFKKILLVYCFSGFHIDRGKRCWIKNFYECLLDRFSNW